LHNNSPGFTLSYPKAAKNLLCVLFVSNIPVYGMDTGQVLKPIKECEQRHLSENICFIGGDGKYSFGSLAGVHQQLLE